jgi:CO dehydrogenase maturation factor
MGKIIAVAGKGGTGKTTLAGLIIRYLKEKNKGSVVLAVDADPNANLGEVLGVIPQESIVGILDEISSNMNLIPAGMTKERYIEYRIQNALLESKGFDLLVMGRPEGPGCYCYANNLLRQMVEKLIKNYDYIVIDNEAGMEHLSRRTMRKADYLFIVSDCTVVGIRSAKKIFNLAKELKIEIKRSLLILNRVKDNTSLLEEEIRNSGIEFGGFLPEDKSWLELSGQGKTLEDLPANSELTHSADEIVKRYV